LQAVRADAKGVVGGVSTAASTIALANKFDYDRYVKQILTCIGNMTVAAPWNKLSEKAKELVGPWTAALTLGSVVLYLLGYLSLRFHLTTLGVGTDLSILDERYLFAGAKFLVYLVSSVPNAAVVGLLLLLLGAFLSLPYRLLPHTFRTQVRSKVGDWWACLLTWWCVPTRMALTGIVLAIVLIQFVMRQCFVFSNLLLAPRLPEPAWLRTLLLTETDSLRSLFFAGLVAGTALTGGLYVVIRRQRRHTPWSRILLGFLAFLVAVQCLLLPVNYGILIADKTMPRVATLGGIEALGVSSEAWLVWEGKEGVTYLVRGKDGGKEVRKLVTLLRSDVKKTEMTAYDPILRVLFAPGTTRAGAP
jgi:hypothetical protein